MDADSIIVLKKGKDGCGEIAEMGTHRQLLQRKGIYAGLWKKQTSEDKAKKPNNMLIESLLSRRRMMRKRDRKSLVRAFHPSPLVNFPLQLS